MPRDVCNEIIRQAFAAEGFQLRDPRTLRYRPHIEEAPEQIILHIEQPVKAELRGKWTQPQLTTMVFDFADLTFSSSTITARGALIYNTTTAGGTGTTDTVVVLDFGSDKSSSAGDFTIVFPTADASNAIIRIA